MSIAPAGLQEQSVERIDGPIADEIIRGSDSVYPRLIKRRVALGIVRAGDCTPVKRRLGQAPGTYDDVVHDSIHVLAPVLDVNTRTAYIPDDIILDKRAIRPMYDDTPLMTVFDGIIRKLASGTVAHHMKVEAVLPSDAPLAALFDSRISYGHGALVHLSRVQSHRALGSRIGAFASLSFAALVWIAGIVRQVVSGDDNVSGKIHNLRGH